MPAFIGPDMEEDLPKYFLFIRERKFAIIYFSIDVYLGSMKATA